MWDHDRYHTRPQVDLRGRIPHDYHPRGRDYGRDYYRDSSSVDSRSRSRSRGRYRSRSRSHSRDRYYHRERRERGYSYRSPPRYIYYERPSYPQNYYVERSCPRYRDNMSGGRSYGRPKTCDNCGSYDHLRAQCTDQLQCHACGGYDHVKSGCPHTGEMCEVCGKIGHLKNKCHQAARENAPPGGGSNNEGQRERAPRPPRGDIAGKKCDNCGQFGHLRATCGNPPECHACGAFEHVKADCPHLDKTCGICGKVGHLKAKCHADGGGSSQGPPRERRQRDNRDQGPKVCRNCSSADHLVASCPNPRECNACGSIDHMKADCEQADSTCGTCGRVGHLDIKCRQATK